MAGILATVMCTMIQEAEDHGLAVSQSGIVFASIFILQVGSPVKHLIHYILFRLFSSLQVGSLNITHCTFNTYFNLPDNFCTCVWEAHIQDRVN